MRQFSPFIYFFFILTAPPFFFSPIKPSQNYKSRSKPSQWLSCRAIHSPHCRLNLQLVISLCWTVKVKNYSLPTCYMQSTIRIGLHQARAAARRGKGGTDTLKWVRDHPPQCLVIPAESSWLALSAEEKGDKPKSKIWQGIHSQIYVAGNGNLFLIPPVIFFICKYSNHDILNLKPTQSYSNCRYCSFQSSIEEFTK